jgi:hypothetical protein
MNMKGNGKMTIWDALAVKLGRQPTNEEAKQDVLRILREARQERESQQ